MSCIDVFGISSGGVLGSSIIAGGRSVHTLKDPSSHKSAEAILTCSIAPNHID